jgi:hypothetical protein
MAKQVSIDFLTRLKDKGFKDLEKASKKQSSVLAGLGKQLAAVFSVAAVVKFGKESVRAFQDAQKEANQLKTQLKSLNLGFAQLQISDFIRDLALATGVTGGALTDAFITLSQATNDVTKAQKLLKLSLDISASTGKDLRTVTVALQRAQAGQLSALTRLQIGFTSATLEGKDFDEVLADLQKKFSGSALVAADTFEGKINRLKEAVEEAKEAFGESLVEGIEASNVSVETLQKNIIDLGASLGNITGKIIAFNQSVIQDVTKEFEEDQGYFASFVKSLVKTNKELAAIDGGRLRAATRAQAQIRKVEAENAKNVKKTINIQKKADADKKRSAELERLRNRISYKFDIDAINLNAALRRDLSIEDKSRVLELAALKKSEYQTEEEAIKTLTAAIEATSKIKPDIKFNDNLDDILEKLRKIIEGKYSINIGATITVPNIPAPGGSSTASPGGGNFIPGAVISPGTGEPGTGTGTSIGTFPTVPGTGSSAIIETISNIISNQNTLTEDFLAGLPSGLDANALATARYELQARTITAQNQLTNYLSGARYQGMANEITSQNTLTNQLAADRYTAMQGFYTGRNEPVVVNVNVQGSVVAQNDLVAAVTDAVYATQRSGNNLLLAE